MHTLDCTPKTLGGIPKARASVCAFWSIYSFLGFVTFLHKTYDFLTIKKQILPFPYFRKREICSKRNNLYRKIHRYHYRSFFGKKWQFLSQSVFVSRRICSSSLRKKTKCSRPAEVCGIFPFVTGGKSFFFYDNGSLTKGQIFYISLFYHFYYNCYYQLLIV